MLAGHGDDVQLSVFHPVDELIAIGRPLVLLPELPDVETDPDEGALGPADAVNIWRGVLITAERTFRPEDDVCKGQREPSDPSSTPGALAKVLDPIVRP